MKISVKREACVGAGQCVSVASETFDQDDDGIVLLIESRPKPEHQEAALLAVSLCPARAISFARE